MKVEIPEGWVNTNLEQVVLHKKGKKPKETIPNLKAGYVPYILIDEMEGKTIRAFTNDEKVPIANEDDVLIVWDGSIGKSATGMRGAIGSTIAALSPIVIKPHFLNAFLQLSKPKIQQTSRGTGLQHINPITFWPLKFPLPPLSEQERIAAKLDHIMPKIEGVKERLERIPQIIKRFRQSVLTAAVTGKLTEKWREEHPHVVNAERLLVKKKFEINHKFKDLCDIPEKWKWCALGNYSKLSRGRFSVRPRNDPRYYGGKYPFIQIGNLPREGSFVRQHKQTLNEKGLKVSKRFPKNTIAIAIVGATIGNTGILEYEMCFPDSLVGIETVNEFTSIYVDYYLRIEKENIRQISYSSGGQPNIKLPTLNCYPFPLPPLEEQREIVRQADKLFAFADKLEEHYRKAKVKIDKLPPSVLAKAFRGELVPQDPNDEPAEKLLERIKEEKARLEAEMKKIRRKVARKKK